MIFDARSSVELLDDGRDGLRRFIGVYSFRWFHSVRWSHWLGWSRWFRWSSRGGWASIGSGPGFRLDIPDRTAMACFQAEGQGNTVSLVCWMGAGCGRGGEVRRCVYESVEGCCAGEGGGAAVVAVAAAVPASPRWIAAERASTLSAAESMVVCMCRSADSLFGSGVAGGRK